MKEKSQQVKMYFLQYKVEPLTDVASGSGGAFVNCWLRRKTKAIAVRDARKLVVQNGWKIRNILEQSIVCQDDYQYNHAGRKCFDQALIDNEVLVFHAWPARE